MFSRVDQSQADLGGSSVSHDLRRGLRYTGSEAVQGPCGGRCVLYRGTGEEQACAQEAACGVGKMIVWGTAQPVIFTLW